MAEQSGPTLQLNGGTRGLASQDDVGSVSLDTEGSHERGDTISRQGDDAVDGLNLQTQTLTPTRNEFSSRKTLAHAMMDAALLAANISQLRMLLVARGENAAFFVPLLCLIVFSILCQIAFAVLIVVLWARESQLCGNTSAATSSPCHSHHHHNNNNNNSGVYYDHVKTPRQPHSTLDIPAATINTATSTNNNYDQVDGLRRERNGDVRSPLLLPHASPFAGPSLCDVTESSDDVIAQRLHLASVVLVFVITVTNMFIMGLGFDPAATNADRHTH